jgi:hypothetical protein
VLPPAPGHDIAPMQEISAAQATARALAAERDGALQQAQAASARCADEAARRTSQLQRVVQRLARKEQELVMMRIQVNNHRLGTVVQKFSGSLADGAQEAFEPAFAYHQLQQVRAAKTAPAGAYCQNSSSRCVLPKQLQQVRCRPLPCALDSAASRGHRAPAAAPAAAPVWPAPASHARASRVQRINQVEAQKQLVEVKRVELRSRKGGAGGDDQACGLSANLAEALKVLAAPRS